MTTTDPGPPPLVSSATRPGANAMAGMLLLAALWGLSIPVTGLGLDSTPPMAFTALRFPIALPILFVFAMGRHRVPLSALPALALLGLVGIGIGNVAQSFGVASTSASVSTILSATIPVLIVVLAALRLRHAMTRLQQAGPAAPFARVAVVAFGQGGAGGLSGSTARGTALVLLSAAAIAVSYVGSVELAHHQGTIPIVVWSTLAGFLALLPFTSWEVAITPAWPDVTAVAAAVHLGLCVSAAGLFLWLRLLRTRPARFGASVQFLQPVIGIAACAAIFGDPIGLAFLLGTLLVVAGVATTAATAP